MIMLMLLIFWIAWAYQKTFTVVDLYEYFLDIELKLRMSFSKVREIDVEQNPRSL
jgi:hypothetical protein